MLRTLAMALTAALLTLAVSACAGEKNSTASPDSPSTVAAPSVLEGSESPRTPMASPSPETNTPSPSPSPTSETMTAFKGYYPTEDLTGLEPAPLLVEVAPNGAVARETITAWLASDPPTGTTQPFTGVELLGVELTDRVLTVDLSSSVADLQGSGSGGEVLSLQALVWTATQFSTVDQMRLVIDGEPRDTLWRHGVDVSEPLTPDEFLLVPIIIDEVVLNEREATITGTANVFEATIGIEIRDSDANLIEESFTTATCGTGCRGAYEVTLSLPGPGTYTVTLSESDPSDGEGAPPYSTQTSVTVE